MINFFKAAWRRKRQQRAAALRLRVAPEVKASLHLDGVVLIHLRKGTVFSANRAGARIWMGAAEQWSMDRLIRSISEEFNVSLEIAQRDAMDFIKHLIAEGLLTGDAV